MKSKRRGAPTKYKPEYCDKLISLMKQGFSVQAVAAELEVNQDTVFEWIKKQPRFSEAYKKGKMFQHIWWEKAGRAIALGAQTKEFDSKRANPTIFIWMSKNLLGWKDKQQIELSGPDGGPQVTLNKIEITPDVFQALLELDAKLNPILPTST